MATDNHQIIVLKDIPDFFYSYEIYNFSYTVTNYAVTTITITYQDQNGTREAYRKSILVYPINIQDIGSIVEPFSKLGFENFTLTVTAKDAAPFVKEIKVSYIAPYLEIISKPSDFIFSSSLDRFSFSLVGSRADYLAKFKLLHDTDVILSGNYVPDSDNIITIYDLCSLINPYLKDNLIANFDYAITIIDTKTNEDICISLKSFTAVYSQALIDIPAEDFIRNFFLSALMGVKVTAFEQKEYLHFMATDEDFVSGDENKIAYQIFADYVDKDMNLISYSIDKDIQLDVSGLQVVTIDASPDNFVQKGLMLVSYKIAVRHRSQTYRVGKRYDSAPDIAFKNSFGLLETLYFTGTKEDVPEVSRSAGYINGEYRNYHIEENRVVKANTGVIPETMVCLVDELARSTEAYLIEKGEIGRQITVTDSELKRTNDLDSLFSFQITYRIAKRNQNILKVVRPAKTFDSTFDKTFE